MKMEYIVSPPNKWTFQPPKIRRLVEKELEGRVLNLFAGKTKLKHRGEIVRNDLDESIDADHHFDAMEVDEHFNREEFDTVILDPPYTLRKSREKYQGKYKGKFTKIKEKVVPLVRPGGKVITFGYSSTGMSKKRGFEKEKIYLINHLGDHNDTICVVERKYQRSLEEWAPQSASQKEELKKVQVPIS